MLAGDHPIIVEVHVYEDIREDTGPEWGVYGCVYCDVCDAKIVVVAKTDVTFPHACRLHNPYAGRETSGFDDGVFVVRYWPIVNA